MHIGFTASRSWIKGVRAQKARSSSQLSSAWDLRYGWVMILAFLVQVYTVYGLGSEGPLFARKGLVLGSYLVLGFTVWSNRHRRGMILLGLGLALNLLAIAANGGLMPVAPEAMLLAGKAEQLASLAPGQWVPASKDILLPPERTILWPLTDVLVYRSAFGGSRIFSIGDVVIALGVFLTVADLFRSKAFSRELG